MGRLNKLDELGEHEGWLVGYVPRAWLPSGGAIALGSQRPHSRLPLHSRDEPLRELGSHDLDREHVIGGVVVVGYACACGWRAPLVALDSPLEWSPASLDPSDELDDRLAAPWREHVEAALSQPEAEIVALRRMLAEARKTICSMTANEGELRLRIAQLEAEISEHKQRYRGRD